MWVHHEESDAVQQCGPHVQALGHHAKVPGVVQGEPEGSPEAHAW